MQADEEFRSQLRDDLQHRSAPPVGALAADALSAGRRMRRRRQTLRAVSGTAAVAAVAVGSATLSGAFGSNSSSNAVAPGAHTPKPVVSSPAHVAPPKHSPTSEPDGRYPSSAKSTGGSSVSIPSSWTVPPAAVVTAPEWITPRAIIAETQKLLPAGASSSTYSGDYVWAGGDPRELWAVDGKMNAATAKGSAEIDVTLHKLSSTQGAGCSGDTSCADETLPDGSRIILRRDWDPMNNGLKGAYVWVIRKDGYSAQVSVRDESKWTDDELFAIASNGAWGSLKMDKTFVDHAEATIQGTFGNPPSAG